MRKMQRSQSSFRHYRTVEAESDQWANESRGVASRQQHSMSLMANEHPDKENNSLFQSVSERQLEVKNTEQHWIERCRHYEKQIKQMHKEREHNQASLAHHYQSQINELKHQLSQGDGQESTVSREAKETHALVKEINSKQIEITHLNEKLECQRGELQTLKLYLSEKEAEIRDWEERGQQVEKRRMRLDQYEAQNTQYQQHLKELEANFKQLKADNAQKEKSIADKGAVIQQQLGEIEHYDQKLQGFEQAFLALRQQKKEHEESIEVLRKEGEHWRKSYEEALEKQKKSEEWELQAKAYISMNSELSEQKSQIAGELEKMKVRLSQMEGQTSRSAHLEQQLASFQHKYSQAQHMLSQLEEQATQFQQMASTLDNAKMERNQAQKELKETQKELKQTVMAFEQVKAQLRALEEEYVQLRQADGRGREKAEKIDTLMKENARLNATLLNKVDEIEKLRQKINKLEMDLGCERTSASNMKGQMDLLKQEIKEQTLQIDNIRQRLHIETTNHHLTQEELLRLQQDFSALNFNLDKVQKDMAEQKSHIEATHQKQTEELKESLMIMESSKTEAEQMLRVTKDQVGHLKHGIEELRQEVEETQRNEKKHKVSVDLLEQRLNQILIEKRQLEEKMKRMVENAKQARQLSEAIVRMGGDEQ